MNDVNRLRILKDVLDRRLTTRLAVSRLEISDRHCCRLLERCREHRPLSLVNRRRGQLGNRQLMPGLAEYALRIFRERYADFGPTLALLGQLLFISYLHKNNFYISTSLTLSINHILKNSYRTHFK